MGGASNEVLRALGMGGPSSGGDFDPALGRFDPKRFEEARLKGAQGSTAPGLQDEAIKNAKLMERRRQLGLEGRGATWLTGARGDTAAPSVKPATLLGG